MKMDCDMYIHVHVQQVCNINYHIWVNSREIYLLVFKFTNKVGGGGEQRRLN